METTRPEPALGPIRLLFEVGTVAGMSDGQLLDRFLARLGDEEAAEVAFAALVERHGPMVLGVCRARLGDEHDAQDAFQATFLILARKARSIRDQESAASWLQGVARRVASCARRAPAVRRAKERKAAGGRVDFVADAERSDLVPAIREEVGDLPEKERTPLTLCLLDGLTHEEAAARLGWPVGTVKTRVRRAKDRLRARLTRRGLAPSLGAIAGALSGREASAMPAALVRATARAAIQLEAGRSAAQLILSASVARLVELGMGSLIMTRLKIAALLIASVGLLAAGAATGLARQSPGPKEEGKPVAVLTDVDGDGKPDLVVAKGANLDREAEATKQDALERLELARLRLEILREKVELSKTDVIKSMKSVEDHELWLKNVRSASNMEELNRAEPWTEGKKDFDATKREAEGWRHQLADARKEDLKRSLANYSAMKSELAREEQRLKEQEALAVPSGRIGPAEGGPPADDDRLGSIEASKLDIELLEQEVNALKNKVTTAMQSLLGAKEGMQSMTAPANPVAYGFGPLPEPLKGEALEVARKKNQEYLDYCQKHLEEARAAYLSKNRELKREQRRLEGLQKSAGTSEVRTTQAGPSPAGLERRLSDVERKLDLILKTMEKQGREPGKE